MRRATPPDKVGASAGCHGAVRGHGLVAEIGQLSGLCDLDRETEMRVPGPELRPDRFHHPGAALQQLRPCEGPVEGRCVLVEQLADRARRRNDERDRGKGTGADLRLERILGMLQGETQRDLGITPAPDGRAASSRPGTTFRVSGVAPT